MGWAEAAEARRRVQQERTRLGGLWAGSRRGRKERAERGREREGGRGRAKGKEREGRRRRGRMESFILGPERLGGE